MIEPSSTKPYFIRAIHEWCTDNGFTPMLMVHVDGQVQVPKAYVTNGEIVLNISWEATQGLVMDNQAITLQARFGGKAAQVHIPISHVLGIFARENNQGMGFEIDLEAIQKAGLGDAATGPDPSPPEPQRPGFRRVK